MSDPAPGGAPTLVDPVARAASTVIGGPRGRRMATATGFWGAVPVLVLLATVLLAGSVSIKQHCRAEGWSTPDQFWHACYSDIPVLFASSSLGGPDRPTLGEAVGPGGLTVPPLAGAAMWTASAAVSGSGADPSRRFFDLSAVLMLVAVAVAVAATALVAGLGRAADPAAGPRSGRGTGRWDAAHLALSPVLVTAALISYELLAVALVGLALLALARGRPVVGGVLLAAAVGAAPQLAVVGLAVLLLALVPRRLDPGVARAAAAFTGTAVVGWLLLRAVLLPGVTGRLPEAWTSWRQAVPGYGSLWLGPQLLAASRPKAADSAAGRALQSVVGFLFDIGSLGATAATVLTLLLLALLAAVIVRRTVLADGPDDDLAEAPGGGLAEVPGDGLAGSAATGAFVRDRVAPLSLALLAAVLVSAKAVPVQASLLLLPFVALSALRWRDHLVWATTELVYFVGIWLYIAAQTTPDRGLPAGFYLVLLLARLGGISWLGVQAVRSWRSPGRFTSRLARPVDNRAEEPAPVDRFLPGSTTG